MNSASPFSAEMEERELAWRDKIEDRISALPPELQDAERCKEQDRIRDYEERKAAWNQEQRAWECEQLEAWEASHHRAASPPDDPSILAGYLEAPGSKV